MPELLTDDQIQTALSGDLTNWKQEGTSIVRSVEADTFAAGIKLVAVVGALADEMNHHPDIDIRWTTVTFRLSTHSEGGLTQNDVDLAAAIDRAASAA
jgi:4a-hydroxytetrahydrobiopterin dehydratase